MKKDISLLLLAVVANLVIAQEGPVSSLVVDLSDDSYGIHKNFVEVAGNSTYLIDATLPPSGYSFVVVQLHSFLRNVTLNHMSDSVTGTNVGLVVRPVETQFSLIIKNDNTVSVHVMVVIVPYSGNVPVPGVMSGFHFRPDMELSVEKNLIRLSILPALPSRNDTNDAINYRLFLLHTKELDFSAKTYFNSISLMLSPDDILLYGTEFHMNSDLTQLLAAYPGTGLTVVIMAEDSGLYSAYVPSFTYSCLYGDPAHCSLIESTYIKVGFVFLCVLGLVLCLYGAKTGIFGEVALVLLLGLTFALLLLYDEADENTDKYVWICLGIGFMLSIVFLIVRTIKPKIGHHFSAVTLSLLIFCAVYFYAISNTFLGNTILFWVALPVLLLSNYIPLVFLGRIGLIISMIVVGSFLIILPFDWQSGASIKFIIFDVARRIRVPEFSDAILFPPNMISDHVLNGAWLFLVMLGFYWQRDVLFRRNGRSEVNDRSPLLGN